jgi:hypothetical protein
VYCTIYISISAIKNLSLSFVSLSFVFLHLPLSTAIDCNTLSALSQEEIREGKEEEHVVLDKNSKIDLHINNKVWNIPFPCAYAVCAKFCTLLMIPCWRRMLLVKLQRFHRCMRSPNAVCKCKICTSAFSGWTAVVPLPVVECGLPTASPSPPAPVFDAGSSASAPMDVDLVAPPPPPPTAAAVARRSPSPPVPVVVGTIAARRGQPPRAIDAPRGRIIFTGHRPNGMASSSSSNGRA